jgi:hypothetical protein
MDTALVGAVMASKTAQLQTAIAARIMKMNAGNEQAFVQLIEAASQNAAKLANAAAGFGQNVDISV